MNDKTEVLETITSEEFRNAMGHLISGVSVITTHADGVDYGLTASAVSSVSLEPPMLLVCVNQNTGTCHAISKSKSFGVNILHAEQGGVGIQFATPSDDKFRGIQISRGIDNQPLLDDALVSIECRVVEEMTGGTHSVFLAEVQQANITPDKEPLAYYKGKFGDYKQR